LPDFPDFLFKVILNLDINVARYGLGFFQWPNLVMSTLYFSPGGIIVESQEEDGHENDGFNSLLNRLAWHPFAGPLLSQVIYTK
jgi:hypothetical protein